ncbi:hypothetical protein CR513_30929, partial [Mucuna pruriens]
MLGLGASINVMPASIYKSLNFGDLEPTWMTIQLANISIVQPLRVLEDVLVQVKELIFPADFYVLDMEDETFGKESTLILGRPFLMTARTKIDVYSGTLSMEFGDTLVQFNIFEAMKHPTEDHSLFSIDVIEELVEEYFQLSNSKQVYNQEHSECTNDAEVKVAETEEPPIAQLATIFMAEIKSAREGRVKEEIKVNSTEKSNNKADTLAEIISANEDQTQAGVEINVPPGSDSEAAQEVKADSNLTRTEAIASSQPK